MYARRMQIGFFLAIVFRMAPHGGGIMWPAQAWECSRAIYDYHNRK